MQQKAMNKTIRVADRIQLLSSATQQPYRSSYFFLSNSYYSVVRKRFIGFIILLYQTIN